MQKKLLFILGTRPEAIKISPLIIEAKKYEKHYKSIICHTAQHREMTDQVLRFFNIIPDYDLNIMKHNQNLCEVTQLLLTQLQGIINETNPDLVLVQGDTTTAFTGALVAFYNKIPVAHIEAGLRSNDRHSPYPEEMYRRIISDLATYHLTPTNTSKTNLLKENITDNVHIVGNTAIDALLLSLNLIQNSDEQKYYNKWNFLDFQKKVVLVTSHRRENLGVPLENICLAIMLLSREYPTVQFVYPVHPNPNVKQIVETKLSGISNIFLIEPLDYPDMIWIMSKSYIIITDSGGIQEEAPSLGKPVLVTRQNTERTEGIESGNTKLVGTSIKTIVSAVQNLLEDKKAYLNMSKKSYIYGDGKASKYILKLLTEKLKENSTKVPCQDKPAVALKEQYCEPIFVGSSVV